VNFTTPTAEALSALTALAARGGRTAPFALSLAHAIVGNRVSVKQGEWIDKLCRPIAGEAESISLPRIVATMRRADRKARKFVILVGDLAIMGRYTALDSFRANPVNRGSVSFSIGEYGDPASKWFGRIDAQGKFNPGKDSTEAFVAYLKAWEANLPE
jgi:hypothetical protein